MKFKFWGVRGSIPTPGPDTIKYGGNTTCIEVRTDDNELIILDAGSGLFQLSQTLLQQMPINAHILISHTHWDHIHGLPFCMPVYLQGNKITIYGGQDSHTREGIERTLKIQMQPSFFPIAESELKADVSYRTVTTGEIFNIANATIMPVLMNHPVINFGYLIHCDGKSLFFTGDYEPQLNIYAPEDKEYLKYQQKIDKCIESLVNVIQGVDALIIDSSFTDQEYLSKQNWGHGTYSAAITLAKKARVKKLFFTHHEPTRTDAELDLIYAELLANHQDIACELFIAHEGMEVTL
ncbi:MAG: MBL fold metallo-hydrolase [Methyloprofundus sp.]|nr:MBL fold metallo-hydrolase [Methyloprofundus sp.]